MSDNGIDQNTARCGSFSSGAATHAGTANRLNEDAFVNRPDLGLWAVADGAGGHESGEVASAEVAGLLQTIDAGLSAAEMLVEVRSRLEAAHARLHAEASRHGAGATTISPAYGRAIPAPTCCAIMPSPRLRATTAWCRHWSKAAPSAKPKRSAIHRPMSSRGPWAPTAMSSSSRSGPGSSWPAIGCCC